MQIILKSDQKMTSQDELTSLKNDLDTLIADAKRCTEEGCKRLDEIKRKLSELERCCISEKDKSKYQKVRKLYDEYVKKIENLKRMVATPLSDTRKPIQKKSVSSDMKKVYCEKHSNR